MNQDVNNQYSNGDIFGDVDLERKILMRSAQFRVPPGKSIEEAFSLLKSRISDKENSISSHQESNVRRLTWVIPSAAATLLLLFGIWFLFLRSHDNMVVAGMGTHIDYVLPDGSRVTLNADSRIFYNKHEFSKNRRIKLEGEAFFDVVKGSYFLISTKYAEIKVLGTSFNVYARDNVFKVSCLTGKIAVTDENQSVEITPGESAILTGNELSKYQDKHLPFATGWIKGEFYFENSPLDLIFKEIERQFNVKFVVRDSDQKYFTGSFTNNDLKNALDIVCIPMGLIYEIGNNGTIYIRERAK
jgi:transmembrane sensor